MSTLNPGWFYTKHYYRGDKLEFIPNPDKEHFNKKNKELIGYCFSSNNVIQSIPSYGNCSLTFKTSNPGLLVGTGLMHEAGLTDRAGKKVEGEFKLGMQFDYTTGLPYIPGSSIKGVIRSIFPDNYKSESDTDKQNRIKYLQSLPQLKQKNYEDIIRLKNIMFEGIGDDGKPLPFGKRDIFYDAFIIAGDEKTRIFDSDFITPHKNPLKNPIPLMLMKVRPGVSIEMRFNLHDGVISKEDKLELIKTIIMDLGVGAKTNVGYGRLDFVK